MVDILLDTLLDTIKALPFLLAVYLFMEYFEHKVDTRKLLSQKSQKLGPLLGAVAGSIPQCGFSAAAASLYTGKVIGAGTLLAVFVATSDEAIPVLLGNTDNFGTVALLLVTKLVLAILAGYLFQLTVFRRERLTIAVPEPQEHSCECGHNHTSWWKSAIWHTLKIALYLAITLLIVNLSLELLGEENLQKLLLSNSMFQPVLTALIGLVPGCATSVLITQLYVGGSISFGAAIAGLTTGTGFGYLVLLRGKGNRKQALLVILCTYLVGVGAGLLLQLF